VIKSFGSSDTRRLFERERVKRFEAFEQQALRKLLVIHAAKTLADLAALPGNRLERLRGDRRQQHGIRINDQWWVCFVWKDSDAYDVEIVDYHD
jgi:proteic killer suppression protein